MLETSFKTTVNSISNVSDIDSGDEYLRDAQTILRRYKKKKSFISRIQWILQLIQYNQVQRCRSHIADINYKQVLIRSVLVSVIISMFITLFSQKSKKKVKELFIIC